MSWLTPSISSAKSSSTLRKIPVPPPPGEGRVGAEILFRRDREPDPRVVKDPHRLPPGQVLTQKWPVLSYGSPPRYDMTRWRLRLYGEVDAPATLTPDHGGPLRLVVPKRYAWKSAKWLEGLEWVQHDRLGF